MAPKTLSSFNPIKDLSRQKFKMLENDIILVYSNFSKTNQFMNRHTIIPLVKNSVAALDPIFHLKKLFSQDIPPEKSAFSFFQGGMVNCVTYDFFTKKLKSLLTQAGYSPNLYSGQSMNKRGGPFFSCLVATPSLFKP